MANRNITRFDPTRSRTGPKRVFRSRHGRSKIAGGIYPIDTSDGILSSLIRRFGHRVIIGTHSHTEPFKDRRWFWRRRRE